MMLIAASHIREPPYLAVTVGPSSHSPPPMAEALRTTPGPSMAKMSRQPTRGTSINSPVVQRGIALEPGCGAVKAGTRDDVGSATGGASCWVMEPEWTSRKGGERERARDGCSWSSMPLKQRLHNRFDNAGGAALLFQQMRRKGRLGRSVQETPVHLGVAVLKQRDR